MKLFYPKEFIETHRKYLEELFPGVELVDIKTLSDVDYDARMEDKLKDIARRI